MPCRDPPAEQETSAAPAWTFCGWSPVRAGGAVLRLSRAAGSSLACCCCAEHLEGSIGDIETQIDRLRHMSFGGFQPGIAATTRSAGAGGGGAAAAAAGAPGSPPRTPDAKSQPPRTPDADAQPVCIFEMDELRSTHRQQLAAKAAEIAALHEQLTIKVATRESAEMEFNVKTTRWEDDMSSLREQLDAERAQLSEDHRQMEGSMQLAQTTIVRLREQLDVGRKGGLAAEGEIARLGAELIAAGELQRDVAAKEQDVVSSEEGALAWARAELLAMEQQHGETVAALASERERLGKDHRHMEGSVLLAQTTIIKLTEQLDVDRKGRLVAEGEIARLGAVLAAAENVQREVVAHEHAAVSGSEGELASLRAELSAMEQELEDSVAALAAERARASEDHRQMEGSMQLAQTTIVRLRAQLVADGKGGLAAEGEIARLGAELIAAGDQQREVVTHEHDVMMSVEGQLASLRAELLATEQELEDSVSALAAERARSSEDHLQMEGSVSSSEAVVMDLRAELDADTKGRLAAEVEIARLGAQLAAAGNNQREVAAKEQEVVDLGRAAVAKKEGELASVRARVAAMEQLFIDSAAPAAPDKPHLADTAAVGLAGKKMMKLRATAQASDTAGEKISELARGAGTDEEAPGDGEVESLRAEVTRLRAQLADLEDQRQARSDDVPVLQIAVSVS